MMVTSVLPLGYKYLVEDEKFISNTNYECSFRIRGLNTEENAKIWLQKLREISQITWKVSRTYPNSGKINIHKSEYRCHHNVCVQKYQGLKRSKNTNCPANLQIIIRRYSRSSARFKRDPLIKLWPCFVRLSNNHNHPINSAEILQYRTISESGRDQLKTLFTRHHSPISAIEMMKLSIYINSPHDYGPKSVDNYFIPQNHFTYREYSKLYGTSYQKRDKTGITENLENLLSNSGDYRVAYTKINEQTNIHIVAILSPIAIRVHKLVPEAGSVLYIRTSTIGCQGQQSQEQRSKIKCILLTTYSLELGQLPLGIIYSESTNIYDHPESFSVGMRLWKNLLPPDSFYGTKSPDLILLDSNYTKCVGVLQSDELFPKSKVFLHQNYILAESWDWLMDDRNEINLVDRWELYRRIKIVLRANSLNDFREAYENCIYTPTPSNLNYGNYEQWIESVFTDTRQQWSNFMRIQDPEQEQSQPGTSTGSNQDLIEILSILLLSNLFSRTKNFNIVQFTDFVLTLFDNYWENLILDCITSRSGGNYVSSQLNLFLPPSCDLNGYKIKRIGTATTTPYTNYGLYEVVDSTGSSANGTQKFIIDLDILRCSCSLVSGEGQTQVCSHLSSVLQKYSISQSIYTTISPTSKLRQLYYKVVTGKELSEDSGSISDSRFRILPPTPATPSFLHKQINPSNPEPQQPSNLEDYISKLTPNEIQDGNQLLGKINSWLSNLFQSNPFSTYPALKTMWRTMESLQPGTTDQTDALFNFGKDLNPLYNRIELIVPERKTNKEPKPGTSRNKQGKGVKSSRRNLQPTHFSETEIQMDHPPLPRLVKLENIEDDERTSTIEEIIIPNDDEEAEEIETENLETVNYPVQFIRCKSNEHKVLEDDEDELSEEVESETIIEEIQDQSESYELVATGHGTYVPVLTSHHPTIHSGSETIETASAPSNYVTIIVTTNGDDENQQSQSQGHEQAISFPFSSNGTGPGGSIILTQAQFEQLQAENGTITITTGEEGEEDDDEEAEGARAPEMELEIDVI